jgi:hypothetical protein
MLISLEFWCGPTLSTIPQSVNDGPAAGQICSFAVLRCTFAYLHNGIGAFTHGVKL